MDPLMLVAAIIFVVAFLWFAVESFLYIRHTKRMKRIWELLERLDLEPKDLMTPFAAWGMILGFIALVVCFAWVFQPKE